MKYQPIKRDMYGALFLQLENLCVDLVQKTAIVSMVLHVPVEYVPVSLEKYSRTIDAVRTVLFIYTCT